MNQTWHEVDESTCSYGFQQVRWRRQILGQLVNSLINIRKTALMLNCGTICPELNLSRFIYFGMHSMLCNSSRFSEIRGFLMGSMRKRSSRRMYEKIPAYSREQLFNNKVN